MEFTPEPGNSVYDDFENQLAEVISIAAAGGQPAKLDPGGVDIFRLAGLLKGALIFVEDRLPDFIECPELEVDDDLED